jgi:hypothetical protein
MKIKLDWKIDKSENIACKLPFLLIAEIYERAENCYEWRIVNRCGHVVDQRLCDGALDETRQNFENYLRIELLNFIDCQDVYNKSAESFSRYKNTAPNN